MPPNDQNDLDTQLLAAHGAGDKPALVALYTQAADMSEAKADYDAACFYLTHAYVFALDAGSAQARTLHGRLKAFGREE